MTLSRSRRIQLVIAAFLAVVLAAGFWVGSLSQLARAHAELAPQRQVDAYLDAIIAGREKDAIRIGGIKELDVSLLMTQLAYRKVADRVTAYRVLSTSVHGTKATVVADVTQGAESYRNSFRLHSRSQLFGLVTVWRLNDQAPPRLTASVDGPSATLRHVDGIDMASFGVPAIPVFPGRYTVTAAATQEVTGGSMTILVKGFGKQAAAAPIKLGLTAQGETDLVQGMSAYLQHCLSEQSIAPDGCPFALDPDAGASYHDIHWTLDAMPLSAVTGWDQVDGSWQVTALVAGAAHIEATESGPYSGQVYTDPMPFGLTGLVTLDHGFTSLFTPTDFDAPGQAPAASS